MNDEHDQNCYAKCTDSAEDREYSVYMMNSTEIRFRENLVILRGRSGLTQEQLAETIGVSRNAIAKWEAGLGIPSIRNLIALKKFFNVSIDDMLLENTGKENEQNEEE